jgi:hypothetical protein
MNNELEEPTIHRRTNITRSESLEEATAKDVPTGLVASSKPTTPLKIHFIKSPFFRVVHASGVWYGGDSQQNLHLTVFNERTAIPKMMVVNLNEKGMVVDEDLSQRESKEGIVRELEVDIVVSIPAAVEFYRTLGENLKALKAI